MNYDDLVKSNWGFISTGDQEKIRRARILLAGSGLGSNIAVLAARTGFASFVVADGDIVELGNLNRQAFRLEQVGENKAEATARLVREINPQAEVEVFPDFINNGEDATTLVGKSDLVVNMVDPGPVMYQINQAASVQNKTVFFPLNIGFGGVVLVSSPGSSALEEILGQVAVGGSGGYFLRLVQALAPFLPSYLERYRGMIGQILQEDRGLPQLGVAAGVTASLTVTAMVKATLGIPIEPTSGVLTMDSWEGAKYGIGN